MPRFALAFALTLAAAVHAAAAEFTVTDDVIYGHKAGMALTFDVVTPAEANGVGLLYMVSSGYVSEKFPLESAVSGSIRSGGRFGVLVSRGYTLFIVRHGSSPWFTVPEIFDDVSRATRFIGLHAADYNVDPDRLGVFGNSAGGHLSLMLATSQDDGDANAEDPVLRAPLKIAAAGVYYPPVDLRGMESARESVPALNFDAARSEELSPILRVTSKTPPVLLVHGNKDTSVPIDHSERMHKALKDAGVATDFVIIEGAGHAFRGRDAHTAATALADWFDRHLLR